MITEKWIFFLIKALQRDTWQATRSSEILIVDEYSSPRRAYIMWKLNSKHGR